MLLNEAIKYLKKEVPDKKIRRTLEYPSYFMFATGDMAKNALDAELDSTYLVDKKDGHVCVFSPTIFPKKELMYAKTLDYKEI